MPWCLWGFFRFFFYIPSHSLIDIWTVLLTYSWVISTLPRCTLGYSTLMQQLISFYHGVSLQWWSSQFSFVTIILREDAVQALLACLVLELDGNWGHKSLPFVFLAWEVLFLRPYNIQLSCLQKNPSKPWLVEFFAKIVSIYLSFLFRIHKNKEFWMP